jgi:HEPN domain-containing protein
MANRAQDWPAQAERDLQHAENSRRAEEHEWAYFAAHQAAEKAVKGLHLHLGQEALGHLVARLLRELPVPVPDGLVDGGMVLDTLYVPSRYPNSYPEGAPFEHYGALQSEEGIGHACAILAFVRSQMA